MKDFLFFFLVCYWNFLLTGVNMCDRLCIMAWYHCIIPWVYYMSVVSNTFWIPWITVQNSVFRSTVLKGEIFVYFTKVELQLDEGPCRNVRQEFYAALQFAWVHKQGVNIHTELCIEWDSELHHVCWSLVQCVVGKQAVPIVSQSNLSKLTLLNLSMKHYRAKEIKVNNFAMDVFWIAVVFYITRDKNYSKTTLVGALFAFQHSSFFLPHLFFLIESLVIFWDWGWEKQMK